MPARLDPRQTLARPDLADQRLDGVVAAAAYRATVAHQCVTRVAAMRAAPDAASEQTNQLLFGEAFDVLDSGDGWAWGQSRRDGYVGWVQLAALAGEVLIPTHRVSAVRGAASDLGALPLNALVTIETTDDGQVRAARAGAVAAADLADLSLFDAEPIAVAERFMGTHYVWGGRVAEGLDCSGLVQQALYACGRGSRRDADQQADEVGAPIRATDLRRGDLVFWPEHVGLMLDETRLLHANGHHMAVTADPLAEVVTRIGREPTAYRRP
ncbi:MAG TPA: NlpC/P60 family protein [Caulobacteraceae bacterium]